LKKDLLGEPFSLFSRLVGGRLGEEGRGDEGSGGPESAAA